VHPTRCAWPAASSTRDPWTAHGQWTGGPGVVIALAVNPQATGVVYVASQSTVQRFDRATGSWTTITGTLPVAGSRVRGLVTHPDTARSCSPGSTSACSSPTTMARAATPFDECLPNAPVLDIQWAVPVGDHPWSRAMALRLAS
jgi:hypothetical protein